MRVTTSKGVIEAGELLLAAGGWTPGLANDALPDMRLLRQVQHWLPPTDPAMYTAGTCPVFVWAHGSTSEDCFYGWLVYTSRCV